jgi:hypothetical protein
MAEQEQAETTGAPIPSTIHTVPHNFTVAEPSPKMMRQIMVYSTSFVRWIAIIHECKSRRINLVGGVANLLLGVFLTALAPAISDMTAQKKFALTPWIEIGMLSLLGAVLLGVVYYQMGTYEGGSLKTLAGELEEYKNRFDGEQ